MVVNEILCMDTDRLRDIPPEFWVARLVFLHALHASDGLKHVDDVARAGLRVTGLFREGAPRMRGASVRTLYDALVAFRALDSTMRQATKRTRRKRRGKASAVYVGGTCVVCMDRSSAVVFVPCGHHCTCRACSRIFDKGTGACPVCRQAVTAACFLR